jgi:DNA replication and repair protein RecF
LKDFSDKFLFVFISGLYKGGFLLHIKSLRLVNFRNYPEITIQFSKNINILYGDNAQGKTNILESIFLCASGRSHRTTKDIELLKKGEKAYYIGLEFIRRSLETKIEIMYKTGEKKSVKINGIPARKIGELIGNLNVVIFSPEDILMIKEGPAERRRFVDITISQTKPAYFFDMQQYMKILAQRNSLLKQIQENPKMESTLPVWNSNLVKTGARIIRARQEYIKKLSALAFEKHGILTNNKENLKIKYVPAVKTEDLENTEIIEKAFLNHLERLKPAEIAKGTTLTGPQRDDYAFFIDGMDVRSFGSQGQQRTAALSVKLAEIEIMRESTGYLPVLLLDDVMSELDEKRQKFLIDAIKGIQTFITCTDKSFFENRLDGEKSFYHIEKGSIRKQY